MVGGVWGCSPRTPRRNPDGLRSSTSPRGRRRGLARGADRGRTGRRLRLGGRPDRAAAATRAGRGFGGSLAWAFDPERLSLPVPGLPVEGAVIARATREAQVRAPGYDLWIWRWSAPLTGCGRSGAGPRWSPLDEPCRDLVDGPPNEVAPAGMARVAHGCSSRSSLDGRACGRPDRSARAVGARRGWTRKRQRRPAHRASRRRRQPALGLVGKSMRSTRAATSSSRRATSSSRGGHGRGAAKSSAPLARSPARASAPGRRRAPAAENMVDGAAFRPATCSRPPPASGRDHKPRRRGRLILADGLWLPEEGNQGSSTSRRSPGRFEVRSATSTSGCSPTTTRGAARSSPRATRRGRRVADAAPSALRASRVVARRPPEHVRA